MFRKFTLWGSTLSEQTTLGEYKNTDIILLKALGDLFKSSCQAVQAEEFQQEDQSLLQSANQGVNHLLIEESKGALSVEGQQALGQCISNQSKVIALLKKHRLISDRFINSFVPLGLKSQVTLARNEEDQFANFDFHDPTLSCQLYLVCGMLTIKMDEAWAFAAFHQHGDMLDVLVNGNADKMIDGNGCTILHFAALSGNSEFFNEVSARYPTLDLDAVDNLGRPIDHYAACISSRVMLDSINTIRLRAAGELGEGEAASVEKLEAMAASSYRKLDKCHHTAAHWAALFMNSPLLDDIHAIKPSLLQQADSFGWRPVQFAVISCPPSFLKHMQERYSCRLDVVDRQQRNLAMIACQYANCLAASKSELSTLAFLVTRGGINRYAKDSQGRGLSHYVYSSGSVDAVIATEALGIGMHVDNDDVHPLHLACQFGHQTLVLNTYHRLHVDPSQLKTKDNQNSLHFAINGGHPELIICLVNRFQCRLLSKDPKGNFYPLLQQSTNKTAKQVIASQLFYEICHTNLSVPSVWQGASLFQQWTYGEDLWQKVTNMLQYVKRYGTNKAEKVRIDGALLSLTDSTTEVEIVGILKNLVQSLDKAFDNGRPTPMLHTIWYCTQLMNIGGFMPENAADASFSALNM